MICAWDNTTILFCNIVHIANQLNPQVSMTKVESQTREKRYTNVGNGFSLPQPVDISVFAMIKMPQMRNQGKMGSECEYTILLVHLFLNVMQEYEYSGGGFWDTNLATLNWKSNISKMQSKANKIRDSPKPMINILLVWFETFDFFVLQS